MEVHVKIAVVGAGYVGLANGLMLSEKNEVFFVEIDEKKRAALKAHQCLMDDPDICEFLKRPTCNFSCVGTLAEVGKADFYILCLPTPSSGTGRLDTSILDAVIDEIAHLDHNACVIIKSTTPIGYTSSVAKRLPDLQLFFIPEFLREGRALKDALEPSRIVIGSASKDNPALSRLFLSSAKNSPSIVQTTAAEAEAIKLFSNTFLALRVAFFNEIDTISDTIGLTAQTVIKGMGLDPRIGDFYNVPSFGFGGYCLPKDSKETSLTVQNLDLPLLHDIGSSNAARKHFFVLKTLSRVNAVSPKAGVYRLIAKRGGDNLRTSAIIDILEELLRANPQVIVTVYEPLLLEGPITGVPQLSFCDNIHVTHTINDLEPCDLILANRYEKALSQWRNKILTGDFFTFRGPEVDNT